MPIRKAWVIASSTTGLLLFAYWALRVRSRRRHERESRLEKAQKRRWKSISHEVTGSDKKALERAVAEIEEKEADHRNKELTQVPLEIFENKALTSLNLSGNKLETLPGMTGQLQELKDLNLMNNRLGALPDELGSLQNLYRLGLKSNRLTTLPRSLGGLTSLVELYLTDNSITELPREIGQLISLRKFQASFNKLRSLPPEMASMTSLELLRVAVNPDLTHIPADLGKAPTLCWLSLAGSAFCEGSQASSETGEGGTQEGRVLPSIVQGIKEGDYIKGAYLGSGASGDVFRGTFQGEECAVKIFRSDVSPDGRCVDELDILCSLDHPNITKVVGLTEGSCTGVLMKLVKGSPMADKPNHESLLRCRWPEGLTLSSASIAKIAKDVAAALEYLHSQGIAHGDVYAHNVIVDLEADEGHAILCDFGASFRYPKNSGVDFQALEVRAFGLYVQDLIKHAREGEAVVTKLRELVDGCLDTDVAKRPTFSKIVKSLQRICKDSKKPSKR